MDNISIKISIVALSASLISICWNIVKDVLLDRVKLGVRAKLGMVADYDEDPSKGIFLGVDPNHDVRTDNVIMLFTITNLGRRPVVVSNISTIS